MKRREILSLCATVILWPLAVAAQQPARMRRIAVLMAYAETDPEALAWIAAFRKELEQLGWAESRNLGIDIRWATGDSEPIERFAKELVAAQPALILASTTTATAALLRRTHTIPIVFALV